ncbi:alpha-2,8-polysialyltransferase family protein [Psychrobacter sp. S1-30-MNA-CIBAN-0213]|uniref:alpha-2,8-polysialyltransferase family protein n=1 Tax=Psychrobacter sp. S1-30-MNA-CIBAN-0213 TaxID=3140456 RepID=UPI00332130DF
MQLDLTRSKTTRTVKDLISTCNYQNLFVISNLGQLKHITGIIKNKNITNCFLLVVYTESNFTVPQAIHDNFDSYIFDHVLFFKLPKNPNGTNLKNIKAMELGYRTVINTVNPENLYLNSFQFHYSILANVAKKSGLKVILIEEGLGTYRLGLENHDNNSQLLNFDLIKRVSKDTISKTEFFKRLYKKYKMTKELTVESKRFVKKLYLSSEVQDKLINFYPNSNLKNFHKPFLNFDESYTSFPNLTKRKFNIKKNNYYFSFDESTVDEREYALSIIDKYNITSNDYLYLSQKFNIDRNEYLAIVKESILNLLRETDSNIFIKLHPKQEHELVLEGFLKMEKETGGRIEVIKESGFLIEEVIRLSKIKGVIGITSSALVYTSLLSSQCKSYSISDTLVDKLIKHERNSKGISMIKQHTEILRQFDNIDFI